MLQSPQLSPGHPGPPAGGASCASASSPACLCPGAACPPAGCAAQLQGANEQTCDGVSKGAGDGRVGCAVFSRYELKQTTLEWLCGEDVRCREVAASAAEDKLPTACQQPPATTPQNLSRQTDTLTTSKCAPGMSLLAAPCHACTVYRHVKHATKHAGESYGPPHLRCTKLHKRLQDRAHGVRVAPDLGRQLAIRPRARTSLACVLGM